MSDVTDIAEREAREAEGYSPEHEEVPADAPDAPDEDETPNEGDETDGGDEVEGAPVEPQGMSERDIEKMMTKLDAEAIRHAKRVAEITGEIGQDLQPCPLCWTPGFVYPPEQQWITPDRVAAVKRAMGEPEKPPLKAAQDKQTCDECDGYGQTLTGAHEGAQEVLPCRKCNGQGWTAKLAAAPPAPTQAVDPAAPTFPPPSGTADMWGRPAGHVHWGMAPASVGT